MDFRGIVEKYSRLVREKGAGALRKAQDDFLYDIIHADHNAWAYRENALTVFFKSHNSNPKTVDFGTIEKVLRWVNPDATDMVFTHEDTPMGLKITIHGSKVTRIYPLSGLPVAVLDISGTGSTDLFWLRDAPLISIDLSGSSTWNLRQLNQNATLQELRLVGWLNKDYSRLRNLSKLKRVIVDSSDVSIAQKALEGTPAPPQIIGE